MLKFQCSSCGACCATAGSDGRMPNRGDGACVHLTDENLCAIFDDRPDICRADYMHKQIQKTYPHVDKYEYYVKATKVCHMLIDLYELDESYKIPISVYNEQLEKIQQTIINKMK